MASRPASRWHVTCNGSSPTANPSLRSDRAGFPGLLSAMKTCWTRLSKANSQARPAERMLVEIGLMDVYRTGSQPPGGHASILACAKHSSGASRHSETPPNEVCGRKTWKVFYLKFIRFLQIFRPFFFPKVAQRCLEAFSILLGSHKCKKVPQWVSIKCQMPKMACHMHLVHHVHHGHCMLAWAC